MEQYTAVMLCNVCFLWPIVRYVLLYTGACFLHPCWGNASCVCSGVGEPHWGSVLLWSVEAASHLISRSILWIFTKHLAQDLSHRNKLTTTENVWEVSFLFYLFIFNIFYVNSYIQALSQFHCWTFPFHPPIYFPLLIWDWVISDWVKKPRHPSPRQHPAALPGGSQCVPRPGVICSTSSVLGVCPGILLHPREWHTATDLMTLSQIWYSIFSLGCTRYTSKPYASIWYLLWPVHG